MAIEGLLVGNDGFVQVIGQPKSLSAYIPYLETPVEQLRVREQEEAREVLVGMSEEELRAELDRRQLEAGAENTRRRTQKLGSE